MSGVGLQSEREILTPAPDGSRDWVRGALARFTSVWFRSTRGHCRRMRVLDRWFDKGVVQYGIDIVQSSPAIRRAAFDSLHQGQPHFRPKRFRRSDFGPVQVDLQRRFVAKLFAR